MCNEEEIIRKDLREIKVKTSDIISYYEKGLKTMEAIDQIHTILNRLDIEDKRKKYFAKLQIIDQIYDFLAKSKE